MDLPKRKFSCIHIVSSNSVAITHVQVKKQKVVNVESDVTLLDRRIIFQQLHFKILTLSLHKQQAFLEMLIPLDIQHTYEVVLKNYQPNQTTKLQYFL